jgi:serine protease inhibitor ecotin
MRKEHIDPIIKRFAAKDAEIAALRAQVSGSLRLFAWQPKGHGEMSIFVLAENEVEAIAAVEAEMLRQEALDEDDDNYYTCGSFNGWGTDYYVLTVAEPGQVIFNYNE